MFLAFSDLADDAGVGGDLVGAWRKHVACRRHELPFVVRTSHTD